MSDLQARLQGGLGDTYRIEGELGGGGMSRVFLAEEIELGRRVVIKVLPPEMGAGVNKERFQREIKLAASLQHPHVVPLLTAGQVDGDLLYYIMPFIEGESLRAKLAREGELPVGEAFRILREVVDALAYAHRNEVVHRDIKPDNVLLSEGHAVVTDFGVAKAVSASSGGTASSLTSLGVALGTPAYMSPEQAAADPHVDHRADIYAVGALAYEMLTGRPPFVAQSPQQVLAAHVSQTPEPITMHRETIPPAMAEMIMRCLLKRAADRWQAAADLKGQLDAMATPTSGGMTPTGSQAVPAGSADGAAARNHPARVAVLFVVAAAVTLAIAYGLTMALGLPDWVLAGTIGLLGVGVPLIAVTGKHERARAVAATTGLQVATPPGIQRHFTWRKALLASGVAFGGLAVISGGYMAMRALGIGPVGTLMAAGVFDEQERLILAEFENRTTDTTLGQTVTELFRIDLAQSPALVVLEPSQLDQILRHMERPPGTRLTRQLAQEAAEREGIKAYITGEIVGVGSGFALTGRLIGAATGEALVSHSERAADADGIIDAVDRLSAKFRERIGESLRTVRQDPPLERVTTSSMEALRLYAQSVNVGSTTADYDRGIQLLEQAVELDTTFAMAYRKLAAWRSNAGRPAAEIESTATRAYELRARVGDRERWLIEAIYHNYVTDDRDAEENAYLSLLDKYPNDGTALHNQANNYRGQGRRAEAAELLTRSIQNGGAPGLSYASLVNDLGNLGELNELETVLADFQRTYPTHPNIVDHRLHLVYHRGQLDSAEQLARSLRDSLSSSPPQVAITPIDFLSRLAYLRGRLSEGARYERESGALRREITRDRNPEFLERMDVFDDLDELMRAQWYQLDPPVTMDRIERELATVRATLPDSMVPYYTFAILFGRAGSAERASEMLERYRRQRDDPDNPPDAWTFKTLDGTVAMAAGDPVRAGRLFHEYRDESSCDLATCALFEIGTAFDSAGVADSAIHYFERFLTEPSWYRLFADEQQRPVALRRLGELYEERGDAERAVEYYADFVDLWANADPVLQPAVADVRERIARLVGEGR